MTQSIVWIFYMIRGQCVCLRNTMAWPMDDGMGWVMDNVNVRWVTNFSNSPSLSLSLSFSVHIAMCFTIVALCAKFIYQHQPRTIRGSFIVHINSFWWACFWLLYTYLPADDWWIMNALYVCMFTQLSKYNVLTILAFYSNGWHCFAFDSMILWFINQIFELVLWCHLTHAIFLLLTIKYRLMIVRRIFSCVRILFWLIRFSTNFHKWILSFF